MRRATIARCVVVRGSPPWECLRKRECGRLCLTVARGCNAPAVTVEIPTVDGKSFVWQAAGGTRWQNWQSDRSFGGTECDQPGFQRWGSSVRRSSSLAVLSRGTVGGLQASENDG